ncbi:glutaminase kidney isoform, mitochondrial isoform 1 precursor [Oopsacas minuta]|uniref:Poly [ADP-ribose] polymerase n=1 Tax=Oopsacas minuta TaxID=111878 RepID=A0AAV7JWI9_9METZ|nr:glutaminase kidney isoform, mitochondrial isoform 1 precursor [Oopsacas minuta]
MRHFHRKLVNTNSNEESKCIRFNGACVCTALLQNRSDSTLRNTEGKTALDLALDEPVKQVLTGEYNIDELLDTAKSGQEDILINLLTPLNVNCHASDGRKSTPLHLAAGYNRIKVCEILLQMGGDAHAKDKGGLVPLHNACSYGHLEVAELLVRHGADVNAMDLWQFTPLHEASCKGKMEVCSFLLAHGGNPTLFNCHNNSALFLAPSQEMSNRIAFEYKAYSLLAAADSCDLFQLKKLACNETINFQHPLTQNASLHCAVLSSSSKKRQAVELIVKRGADLCLLNQQKLSALHLSVVNQHSDATEVLLLNGALVNSPDGEGKTALHHALSQDCPSLTSLLLDHGADPDITSQHGIKASALAGTNTVSLLTERPRSAEKLSTEKAFLEASKAGDLEKIKELLSPMVVNCRDLDGRLSTPLHFASGYNRIAVVEYLIQHGGNVHAKDKGGLVALHNACSYGHYEVSKILVDNGANVNMKDLWNYTPLHEAAAKGKYDICKLLLENFADKNTQNRDGHTPLDLVKDTDTDVATLLRGDTECGLLEAAKKGDILTITKLLTSDNVNCRDLQGRNSTPLHLAAGYNQIEVAEYLLEHGAEVNAEDKGGLIPLHNASSYGHLDIASLLIDKGGHVNAQDKWNFTPLHEAAHKGRTQLCSLLIAHGAQVMLRNQYGQTPLDLALAEDTRNLLEAAYPKDRPIVSMPSSSSHVRQSASGAYMPDDTQTTSVFASTTHLNLCPFPTRVQLLDVGVGASSNAGVGSVNPGCAKSSLTRVGVGSSQAHQYFMPKTTIPHPLLSISTPPSPLITSPPFKIPVLPSIKSTDSKDSSIRTFLRTIEMEQFADLFEREHITLDILTEVSHNDLKEIGILTYGDRHRILKSVAIDSHTQITPEINSEDYSTSLVELDRRDRDFLSVSSEFIDSIREHKDNKGGVFDSYNIVKIERVVNSRLLKRYVYRRNEIAETNHNHANEHMLFHGSPMIHAIVEGGFDERHSYIGGMFGAGVYFAENSSKSNQYVFGIGGGDGCSEHKDKSCYICERQLLFCRVTLGKPYVITSACRMAHSPPGHHSVVGRPSACGLAFTEYVIYRGEQAYPEFRITYKIVLK